MARDRCYCARCPWCEIQQAYQEAERSRREGAHAWRDGMLPIRRAESILGAIEQERARPLGQNRVLPLPGTASVGPNGSYLSWFPFGDGPREGAQIVQVTLMGDRILMDLSRRGADVRRVDLTGQDGWLPEVLAALWEHQYGSIRPACRTARLRDELLLEVRNVVADRAAGTRLDWSRRLERLAQLLEQLDRSRE